LNAAASRDFLAIAAVTFAGTTVAALAAAGTGTGTAA